MKRLVKRISLPLLSLVALALLAPQMADAGRWRRYARGPRVHVDAPAADVRVGPGVRVDAPRADVRVGRGVHVDAPGANVHVGRGVRVDAPGVQIRVGPWFRGRFGRPYRR